MEAKNVMAEAVVLMGKDAAAGLCSQDVSALPVGNDDNGSQSNLEMGDVMNPAVLSESITSPLADLESSEQITINPIIDSKDSDTNGQVVKLPPISISTKLRNAKGILAPGNLSTKLSSKAVNNSTASHK